MNEAGHVRGCREGLGSPPTGSIADLLQQFLCYLTVIAALPRLRLTFVPIQATIAAAIIAIGPGSGVVSVGDENVTTVGL